MHINTINKHLFNRFIHVTHWLTETNARNVLGKPVLRGFGKLTLAVKKGESKPTIEEAAKEWQRMFPSRKMVPIIEVADDQVTAEIHSRCPYRGSGNVEGCQRMMEYDRRMIEDIGGEFVVTRSQAEPGVEHCQVVIARRGSDLPQSAIERTGLASR